MTIDYRIALKADKKDIARFYKQQHYSASNKGFDVCVLAINNNAIIGIAIVSLIQKEAVQGLLHGVVVDKQFWRLGIASELIKQVGKLAVSTYENTQHIVCFIEPPLAKLYKGLAFMPFLADELEIELFNRFNRYRQYQGNLKIYAQSSKSFTK